MKILKTRMIDYKGRITLPPEVRKLAGIKSGDEVYFEISKTSALIIRKAANDNESNK